MEYASAKKPKQTDSNYGSSKMGKARPVSSQAKLPNSLQPKGTEARLSPFRKSSHRQPKQVSINTNHFLAAD